MEYFLELLKKTRDIFIKLNNTTSLDETNDIINSLDEEMLKTVLSVYVSLYDREKNIDK